MYTAAGTLDGKTMLQRFAPLVRRLAHHLAARLPASVQVDDLIQAGLIALVDAIGRFREDRGAQFQTFATQRIRGAMLDELRVHDWLPRGLRRLQKRIAAALDRAEQRLGRAPSETEVAEELSVPLAQYQQMLVEAHGGQIFYIEDLNGDDEEEPGRERSVSDEADTPMLRLQDERFRSALVAGIEELPEREKLLMGLYYDGELNFEEIACVLGVSESRVCQLHGQAVNRLRAKLKDWR